MDDVPELSVVIAVVSDARHLEACLTALSEQRNAPKMEIIVPHGEEETEISGLRSRFSEVRFQPVPHLEPRRRPGRHSRIERLRSEGIHAAKAQIVALLEDHAIADRDWARRIIKNHNHMHAAVGGAIENEVNRPLNWAVYFSDFGRYQNPVNPGASSFLSDANSAYRRDRLEAIKEVWNEAFHEPVVNNKLLSNGETLWLSPDIVVYQHRRNLMVKDSLVERYTWGRYYAGRRTDTMSSLWRWLFCLFSPALPVLLLSRKIHAILRKRRLFGEFITAFPFLTILTVFWSAGEFVGYLTAKPEAGK